MARSIRCDWRHFVEEGWSSEPEVTRDCRIEIVVFIEVVDCVFLWQEEKTLAWHLAPQTLKFSNRGYIDPFLQSSRGILPRHCSAIIPSCAGANIVARSHGCHHGRIVLAETRGARRFTYLMGAAGLMARLVLASNPRHSDHSSQKIVPSWPL